jgi:hypothetical protein
MGATERLDAGTIATTYVVVNLLSPRVDLRYGSGALMPSKLDFIALL